MHLLRKHLIGLALFNSLSFFAFSQINLTANWEIHYLTAGKTESTVLPLYDNWGELSLSGAGWSGAGIFNGKKGTLQWTDGQGHTGKMTFTYQDTYDLITGTQKVEGTHLPFIASRPHQRTVDLSGTWYDATYDQFLVIEQQDCLIKGYYEPLNVNTQGVIAGSKVDLNSAGQDGNPNIRAFVSVDGQRLWVHSGKNTTEGPRQVREFKKTGGRRTAIRPRGWLGARFNQSVLRKEKIIQRVEYTPPKLGAGLCSDPRTAEIIDSWLALSLPFEQWSKARYDCWGRVVGIYPNGKIVSYDDPPSDTGQLTRTEYVLQRLHNTYSHKLGYSLLQYVKFHLKN